MFSTNKHMFGVGSSYSPDMEGYTTPLCTTDKTSDKYRLADKLAREIEKKQVNELDDREEEE